MTSVQPSPLRPRVWLLLPLFFVSGVSALSYQVVWLKYLGFVFGNTVQAAATLIAIYLAGLGIGAYLFGRFGRRWNPLVAYAITEAAIGAIGAFSPNAFGLLDTAYVASYRAFLDAPAMLAMARIVAASLFLLPPTILMGGTLPLLVRAFAGRRDESGRAVSALYAANTFGATAGVAFSGFYAIPRFGFLATVLAAVVLNFLLAGVSLLLATRRKKETTSDVAEAGESASHLPLAAWGVLLASLLMGFTSIADEVFWSRILVLHLGSSVYAYSLMLFSFLIGLAAGSAVVAKLIRRHDARLLLGVIEVSLAVVLALQIHYFVRFVDVLEFFARLYGAASFNVTLLTLVSAVLTAILLPTALMGATFPLAVKLYARSTGEESGRSVGAVYLFNTIGSIAGSIAAGFLLIRWVGSQNGLLLMAVVNLLIGIAFLQKAISRAALVTVSVCGAAVMAAAFAMAEPNQVLLSAGLFTDQKADVLLFREDVSATVTLRRFGPEELSLELNGVNVAGTSPDLVGTQKLQGHIPLLLHPGAKNVLHIGFGSGGTAWAVSRHPVKELVIAEISPEVLEVSGERLKNVNHDVLSDPRSRPVINDGRNFVLADPEKFDVILSDSIHPRYAGNGSLYTRDYFELCRRKLNPNGVISMWLPFYSLTTKNYLEILRAFHDIFPNSSVWYVPNTPNSFTIVIGRMEPGPIPFERVQAGIRGVIAEELTDIGIHDGFDLASALLMDGEKVGALTAGVAPHTDDLPTVEYESGRLVDRNRSWLANFTMLLRNMSPLERAFSGQYDRATMRQQDLIRARRGVGHLHWLDDQISGRAKRRIVVPD